MINIENICTQISEAFCRKSIMDTVAKMGYYIPANATMIPSMELLKETEDNEFNDAVLFASAHSLRREFYKDLLYC